jgi:hypothetical protein
MAVEWCTPDDLVLHTKEGVHRWRRGTVDDILASASIVVGASLCGLFGRLADHQGKESKEERKTRFLLKQARCLPFTLSTFGRCMKQVMRS